MTFGSRRQALGIEPRDTRAHMAELWKGRLMPARIRKTEDELKQIVMEEIRKHSELSQIEDVFFTRPTQPNADAPNWDVGFLPSGARAISRAQAIIGGLRNRFELA